MFICVYVHLCLFICVYLRSAKEILSNFIDEVFKSRKRTGPLVSSPVIYRRHLAVILESMQREQWTKTEVPYIRVGRSTAMYRRRLFCVNKAF